MKKLLGCFLCVMLLFCLSTPVAADTLVLDVDPPDFGSYWTGTDTNGDDLSNSGEAAEEAWLAALLGFSVDLNYKPIVVPSDGDYISGYENSYAVLKYGNGQPAPFGFEHWAIMDDGDGILELYDVGNPYNSDSTHALYNLGSTIDLGEQALSHVNAAVPEPTTMVLLGFGLVGLAGVGRKKFKK